MISNWFNNLPTKEEQEQFKNEVLGSKRVLKRLTEIVDGIEQGIERQEMDLASYDKPNWDYRQAHINGCKDSLKKIKLIINLDPKDTN